jgi:MFS family permease
MIVQQERATMAYLSIHPARTPVRSGRNVLPPLAGAALAACGSGLIHTLLPLRLLQAGYASDEIGLVATGFSAGFLAGCLANPYLIRSVGHVRAYGVSAACVAASILAYDWQPPLLVMVVLSVAMGHAASGMSVVTESWLNELSAPAWRGRLLTAYVLELALFYGIGQFLALDLDVASSRMLIVPAVLYVLALVPVAGVSVGSPAPPATIRLDLTTSFRIAPVGAVSCLYTGLVSSTFSAIGPLWGTEFGLGQRSVVFLMAAGQVGGLVLQYPLGLVSDRLDRRWVLVAMSVAAMAVSAGFLEIGVGTSLPVVIVLCAIFGGVVESFYPIGVAHASDRADPASYVAVSSNLLLLWALGGTIGPLAGTAALSRVGPAGFFWYALALSAGFLVFALWRIRRRARRAAGSREEFVAYPNPPTSPALFEWVPFRRAERRRSDEEDWSS